MLTILLAAAPLAEAAPKPAAKGSPATPQWKQLAKNAAAELWIDTASIKRNNGEAKFVYRIDYAKPEKELGSGKPYRSVVTRATVRCSAKTIALGLSVAYAGPRATGKEIGRYPPTMSESLDQPVQKDTSDDNLWRYVCQIASLTPK